MAVYNGESYLTDAINSILNQTYTTYELVTVDDGSTDKTNDILYNLNDHRIRVIRNGTKCGLAYPLYRGLAVARSTFIARQHADDISRPDRLQRQSDYWQSYPDVGVVGSLMTVMNAMGGYVGTYRVPLTHGGICWGLCFGRASAHPTVMALPGF